MVFVVWIAPACVLLWFLKDSIRRLFGGLMGGKASREDSGRRSIRSTPSSYSSGDYAYPYPASGYEQPQPSSQPYSAYSSHTDPAQSYTSSSQSYQTQTQAYPTPSSATDARHNKFKRTYSRIADNYRSLDQVTEALAEAGLESSNLIVGIDFTKSNEWTGRNSFHRRSLHHIGDTQNPYEQAISILGRTLSSFDEDNLIPCFGFGDASTHDHEVFSFSPDERPCNGFEEALSQYREIVPHLRLAGPTSFAPIIEMAMTIVEQSGGQYHVLLIIADGQVTRSVDTGPGQLSSQEQKTVDAIVQASHYPLSIVVVGVGDGPWDMMREFDDNIPARSFDNFQFVNFTEIMLKNTLQTRKETEFALAALMEIPSQYKATMELGLLGHQNGKSPERVPLPPPVAASAGNYGMSYNPKTSQSTSFQKSASPYHGYDTAETSRSTNFQKSASPYHGYDTAETSQSTNFQKSASPYHGYDTAASTAPPASNASFDNQVCPICLTEPKNMAFGCGHQTCCECGQTLEICPICRSSIQTRIRLY